MQTPNKFPIINQAYLSNNNPPLEDLLSQKKITKKTYDKVISAKKYIERKYNTIKLKCIEKNILQEKLNSSGLPESKKLEIINEINQKEIKNIRKKLERNSSKNYESLSIIGRGAFGEVHVCREKKTGEIVAIKKIKKDVLFKKNQIKHTLDEQDFLSKIDSKWIVELKASFQEWDYLYLVMEYLPGGDLMGLLIARNIFTEEDSKFYISEMILAIDSIHELNCIHRDIKPDNVLIGKDGHIKLTDFGLAKISDKILKEDFIDYNFDENRKSHNRNFSCVGTAYYAAPEVINKKEYGQEIDWWSLGVILFEMVVGYAPFCSQKTSDVCYKVAHFEQALSNRKRDIPVEDPYTDGDFEELNLTPKSSWTKEELLPSPSLFTSLKLKLDNGGFLMFDTLSSGEKQIIYTLGTTVYQLHHLNSVDANKIQYPCVNIIFDEIELYYHPEYQKGLVKRMLNVIGNMNLGTVKHINMIFATHSPFILSDIHKEHILYLDKGNDVSDKVGVNPFGANINDVLRSSFFLEKGFMGDFVSKKLLDLIDYLDGKSSDENLGQTANQIMEAVGDPFLKERLRDLYIEYKQKLRNNGTTAS